MTKLKKKLTVIVAIFAAIAILGSTAAIFVGTRTNNNEQEVITSPVGYLEGVGTGTGKYAANKNTYVFAENDTSVFLNASSPLQHVTKPVYYGGTFNGNSANDSVYKLTSDENGNGYVEVTSHENANDSTSFAFPIGNYGTTYSNRGGTYVFEFDLMIPEEPVLSASAGNTTRYFMVFPLSYLITDKSSNYCSNLILHDSSVDGYYYLDTSSTTSAAREKVLFKYGEWYNFRFELKLDNTSTNVSTVAFVNGIKVLSHVASYSNSNSITSPPRYFRVSPRMYAHGMTWCIDNVYAYRSVILWN